MQKQIVRVTTNTVHPSISTARGEQARGVGRTPKRGETKGADMSEAAPNLSRRSFMKTTGALGALAAAGGTLAASEQLFGNVTPALADEAAPEEKIAWSQCNVNCGGNCVFQWHSVDGKVQYMETDNTGDDLNFQARACLRGRSMRKWLNHPDRLLYPMKRVGKRGEGKFEQISWDEATDLIAEKLKWVYSEYGPEAIHINYATGMYSSMGKPGNRLLALLGGYLNQGADYSTHMLQVVMPYMFGWDGEKGISMSHRKRTVRRDPRQRNSGRDQ